MFSAPSMTARQTNLVFLLLVSLPISFQQSCDTFRGLTKNDYVLLGYTFDSANTVDSYTCAHRCLSRDQCKSYNYALTGPQHGLCELNSAASYTSGPLQYRPGFVYVEAFTKEQTDQNGTAANKKPKSYKSCKEAYEEGERQDKAYELALEYGKTKVYCQMSPISGCGLGGFSLVMKIDGSATAFLYHSSLWTNRTAYNVPAGSSLNTSGETKLPTYWETSFTKLCLGMKVAGQTKYLSINHTADSLYSLIADGQYRATTLGREAWKSLLSGSSLQGNCNREGFNAKASSTRARIGITSNNENDCDTNDSRIGFGTGGDNDSNDSCGNSAYWEPDNGDKRIRAFGIIFVH